MRSLASELARSFAGGVRLASVGLTTWLAAASGVDARDIAAWAPPLLTPSGWEEAADVSRAEAERWGDELLVPLAWRTAPKPCSASCDELLIPADWGGARQP